MLPRPRVAHLLESAARTHGLVVLTAPPGSGKTTALAAWAGECEEAVAWLTLTNQIRSVGQVLSGLLSALQRIARDRAALSPVFEVMPDAENDELLLDRIGAAIRESATVVNVVIDDAHFAQNNLAEAVLGPLLRRSEGLIRFVIAGTHDLDAWCAIELATGAAVAIGPGELAMNVAEIAAFASRELGPTDETSAEQVWSNTRGWPVAVRLALHARKASSGSGDELLAEYISQAVLQRLRPELVDFVLAATTCSRLDADLARALSGCTDAAALLNESVQLGLFIDRYIDGDNTPVFRWHEVFAQHCRIVLRRTDSARADDLNLRAALHLAADSPLDAAAHALRAGSPALAAQVIRDSWVRVVIDSGAAALYECCLTLPKYLAQSPEMLFIRASCLDVLGDTSGASRLLAQAETASEASGPSSSEELRFTAAFARLFLSREHDALSRAADEVKLVLQTDQPAQGTHVYLLFLLGWTELRLRRDPAGAIALLASARRDALASRHPILARRASTNLMLAFSYSGRFRATQDLIEGLAAESEGVAAAEWQHYDGGIERVARGFMHFWQDDLPGARDQFRSLIQQGGHPASYTALARVYFSLTAAAVGDARMIAEAQSHLPGISDTIAHGVPWPAYRAIAAATLAAASGDSAHALALMAPLLEVQAIPVTNVLMADLYRRFNQPATAMQLLGRIQRPDQASYVRVSALVIAATIARQRGDQTHAHRCLERSLEVAVPEGISRPYGQALDGEELRELLTEHAAWGTAHEQFLAERLASSAQGGTGTQILGAALSPRERDIFGYLCTTMTAEEIARVLHVSVNTIRTHQRAIYRKLGVSNRREAIKYRI